MFKEHGSASVKRFWICWTQIRLGSHGISVYLFMYAALNTIVHVLKKVLRCLVRVIENFKKQTKMADVCV
jgi:hypothetical protein